MTDEGAADSAVAAAEALTKLAATEPALAAGLAKLVVVVVDEAVRTRRFASSLSAALAAAGSSASPAAPALTTAPPRAATRGPAKRATTARRAPGVIDPFAVYSQTGESGLRESLEALELLQLRDIIAEHGMDHDKLAMKWKTKSRVVDRIVDKVTTRSTKGSVFRTESE